jgi:ribosomal protein S18 acetylase RimI-like enzyme
VDEAARGKGIGNRLLAAACRWGIEQGADHLRLSVDRSNVAAQQFYEDRAFTRCDEEQIYMIADDAFRELGTKR